MVARVSAIVMLAGLLACTSPPGARDRGELALWQAKQEIAELQRAYARATDLVPGATAEGLARCAAEYRRIFAPDASIGVAGQMSVTGPEAWLGFVNASLGALIRSQHLIGTQLVEIERLPEAGRGAGAATMTSALLASQYGEGMQKTTIVGTYHARAVHAPEHGWRLAEMTLELTSVEAPE